MSASDPQRFSARWLRFDPQRPASVRLSVRFVVAVLAMLMVTALLTVLAN